MTNNQTPRHPFTPSLFKVALGSMLLLTLTACDGLARFVAKPERKPAEPAVAEQPSPPPVAEQEPIEKVKLKPSPLYEWNGDGRRVTRIVVDTDKQKARFYAGDDEIGWSTVATGVAKYPTPTGQFSVIEKVENKRSNLYGKVVGKGGQVMKSSVKVGRDSIPAGGRFEGSSMPFFMRLTHDGVGLHAGPIPRPGQPASHGCIRMPRKLAPVLFNHVTPGTQVAIVGRGPDYGNYLEKQRAIAAKQATEQRRIAAKKATEATRVRPVAANAQPAPAPTPADSATTAPLAMTPAGEAIESQAVAKEATVQPAAPPAASETHLRVDPVSPASGQPVPSVSDVSPIPATTGLPASAQAPIAPPAPPPVSPISPAPTQAVSTPVAPVGPTAPLPTAAPTEPTSPSPAAPAPANPAQVAPTTPPPVAPSGPASPAPTPEHAAPAPAPSAPVQTAPTPATVAPAPASTPENPAG